MRDESILPRPRGPRTPLRNNYWIKPANERTAFCGAAARNHLTRDQRSILNQLRRSIPVFRPGRNSNRTHRVSCRWKSPTDTRSVSAHRPGNTKIFGVVGKLDFDSTIEGVSLYSTGYCSRTRLMKRSSVKPPK